jgi:hypothetical protein
VLTFGNLEVDVGQRLFLADQRRDADTADAEMLQVMLNLRQRFR